LSNNENNRVASIKIYLMYVAYQNLRLRLGKNI
jgi:hypothetical protein